MKRPPSFPFFTDDWLGSTTVLCLTPAEECGYLRLLIASWNAAEMDCGLPDDDAALAMLSRLGDAWHNGAGEKLKKKFPLAKNGRRHNAKLLDEWEKSMNYNATRRHAANVRWAKEREGGGDE